LSRVVSASTALDAKAVKIMTAPAARVLRRLVIA
jgi:hypothetical protein